MWVGLIIPLVFIFCLCVGVNVANKQGTLEEALIAPIQISLLPKVDAAVGRIMPYIAKAIKTAEGNPRNFGVLSVPTSSSGEANTVLNNSIRNSIIRWIQAGQPIPFSEFMQKRWAPIGAENDPKNLNVNWLLNVETALSKYLGDEEYTKWKRAKMVR